MSHIFVSNVSNTDRKYPRIRIFVTDEIFTTLYYMYEDYKSAKLDVTNNWSRRSALTQTSLRSKIEEGVLCVCSLKHQPLMKDLILTDSKVDKSMSKNQPNNYQLRYKNESPSGRLLTLFSPWKTSCGDFHRRRWFIFCPIITSTCPSPKFMKQH